ncbi:hypothetical protein FD723_41175 (plasmid) [Nostoc sp. C052]|uniref:hypothetical protein n=1 Tax=Nostoc sp. C052 TaxID=2576902 RepID=UPI0015C356B2|nr:hypothetical protein [Nostoc sp. C052]QLE46622.1 hypothetical protein FD723_41175 [Nostoc sp. C052]
MVSVGKLKRYAIAQNRQRGIDLCVVNWTGNCVARLLFYNGNRSSSYALLFSSGYSSLPATGYCWRM